ncbi:hypothetical protein JTB14_016799 [Gonioctena quinquepunctata]|nr:hypothetical protein JTB14_016799 [Gonioctena quinquepunctata]
MPTACHHRRLKKDNPGADFSYDVCCWYPVNRPMGHFGQRKSSLPPLTLGQIWAMADTDADGKMNIYEFSIACKLINLKLRGFDVPKGLPPSLLASLKVNTPPAIPPLPNANLVNAPPRPEPPKVPPMMATKPLIQNQSLLSNQPLVSQVAPSQQPLLSGLMRPAPIGGDMGLPGVVPPVSNMIPHLSSMSGTMNSNIPTGIVPPMQTNIQSVQPLIGGLPPISTSMPPLLSQTTNFSAAPLVSSMPLSSSTVQPLIPGMSAPPSAALPALPSVGPGATSTPRSSIASLERTHSIESMLSQPDIGRQTKLKQTKIHPNIQYHR